MDGTLNGFLPPAELGAVTFDLTPDTARAMLAAIGEPVAGGDPALVVDGVGRLVEGGEWLHRAAMGQSVRVELRRTSTAPRERDGTVRRRTA